MAISTHYQEVILNRLGRDASHVSLHTADPGTRGTSELVSDAYQRQPVTLNPAVGGIVSNSNVLNFDDMPLTTITHYGLWDAEAEGNFLWGALMLDEDGLLAAPMTVEHEGDTIRIPDGRLEAAID